MKPLGLTAYRLAKDIGVPVTRVQAIIAERRGITGIQHCVWRAISAPHQSLAEYAARFRAGNRGEALGSRLETEVKPRAREQGSLRF